MSNEENFTEEDFEAQETRYVDDHPIEEGELAVGVILASKRLDVRYYEDMTIQDALNQVKGRPEDDKFRLLLDGQISTLDSVIPSSSSEVIFVGNWTLGSKKKV